MKCCKFGRIILLIAVSIVLLNGCSLLLPAVVVGTNEMNKREVPLEFGDAENLDQGTTVSIELEDGSWVHGELVSIDKEAESKVMSVRAREGLRQLDEEEVTQVRVQPKKHPVLPAVLFGVGVDTAFLLILILGKPFSLPIGFRM